MYAVGFSYCNLKSATFANNHIRNEVLNCNHFVKKICNFFLCEITDRKGLEELGIIVAHLL